MSFLFRHVFNTYIIFALVRGVFRALSAIFPQWLSVVMMLVGLQWIVAEVFGMTPLVAWVINLVNAAL